MFALVEADMLFLFLTFLVSLCLYLYYLLQPKYFYFVRHGETLLNEAHIKQGADGALSEHGILQAKNIGKALAHININRIYTSPYERAVQTATLIQHFIPKDIVTLPLLVERKNASAVIGKSTQDEEVKRIMNATEYGYHDDSYRFADEENFNDLKARAHTCLSYLTRHACTRSIVVTHHAFLKMLLSYMLHGEKLHANEYVTLSFFNPSHNGGITVCRHSPLFSWFSKTRGWDILAYDLPIEFS